MGRGEETSNGTLEWTINVPGEGPRKLVPKMRLHERVSSWFRSLALWSFLHSCWKIGVNEPKKFIHCLKVSLALCIVSVFYYMRPLYDSVGGNAMWAIMTVVVVFEYTVGATLYKCINRTIATAFGGSLGFGVHWVASQSGEKFEPIILGGGLFIFAGLATYSRFIPRVKAQFDYGASIFILTFSLVSVSGFRFDSKLFSIAYQRVSTIMVGTSLCILISMLFYPAWAGVHLHNQIIQNLEKLANSIEACVGEYFESCKTSKTCNEDDRKKRDGYICVLNSKATEDVMANFAIWEPAHGKFNFGHPWKSYQKIGAAARNLAYCIDSLNICLDSEVKVPEFLGKIVEDECLKVSLYSSQVLKELASMIRGTKKSSKIEFSVAEMNFSVQELHNALKCLPKKLQLEVNGEQTEKKLLNPSIIEILPLAALVSILTEAASRVEEIVDEVNELAKLARFKAKKDRKSEENDQSVDEIESLDNLEEQPSKVV